MSSLLLFNVRAGRCRRISSPCSRRWFTARGQQHCRACYQTERSECFCRPTVLLSNTPHYDTFYGGAIRMNGLAVICVRFRSVMRCASARCNHGLYGNGIANQNPCRVLTALRKDHPDLLIMVDPVIAILIAEFMSNLTFPRRIDNITAAGAGNYPQYL